jgi:hypothetical protein
MPPGEEGDDDGFRRAAPASLPPSLCDLHAIGEERGGSGFRRGRWVLWI